VFGLSTAQWADPLRSTVDFGTRATWVIDPAADDPGDSRRGRSSGVDQAGRAMHPDGSHGTKPISSLASIWLSGAGSIG
jgi:hypothetical protein